MVNAYNTILNPGTGEIVEKKSRFIGYVRHVEAEEDALAFVTEIKKKHYDARHNCYAYAIGQERPLLRFIDDGEPGGTAGKPILEVLTGKDLCDICVVVTRYFGGTLLGTGGLVRAYTEAAQACIGATRMVRKCRVLPVVIRTNYTDLGKIQYILGSEGIDVKDSVYGEMVELRVELLVEDAQRIQNTLMEATAARVELEQGDSMFSVWKGAAG